jgi:CHAT domain-containing protein/tetratricopeptide (TPR) repeat protein
LPLPSTPSLVLAIVPMLLTQILSCGRNQVVFVCRHWLIRCVVLCGCAWPAIASWQNPSSPQKEIRPLKRGESVEAQSTKGKAHYYEIILEKGPVQITVFQDEGHINVSLLDHDGETLAHDGSHLNPGTKNIAVVIEQAGKYQVLIENAFGNEMGSRYRLEAAVPPAPTPQFLTCATAQKQQQQFRYSEQYTNPSKELLRQIADQGKELVALWHDCGHTGREMETLHLLGDTYKAVGEYQTALETIGRAIQLARQTSNAYKTAEYLITLGQTYASLSDYPRALAAYEEALPLWEQSLGGVPQSLVGWNLNNIGAVQNIIGEKQRAIEYHQKAYQLYKTFVGDAGERRRGMGLAANNIGAVYLSLGEKQKAIDSHREALDHFKASGDVSMVPFALNRLGEAYASLGEIHTALEFFQQALVQMRKNDEPQAEASVLNNLGRARATLGDYEQASENLAQSLAIRRKIGDRRGQALSLMNLGSSKTAQGQHQLALKEHLEALTLWREIGDRYGEAYSLHYLGLSHYSLGERQKAREYFERALTLRRAVSDREGEANTLYNLARLNRDENQLAQARNQIEAALALTETIRTSVFSQELRASYLATVRDYYEFYVELLMQLYEQAPSSGLAALALQASEQARARSLLETLTESGGNIREGVPSELLAQERTLQQRLNAKAEYQIRLQIANATAEQQQAVAKEIQALTVGYEAVRSRIRAASPRYAALTQPQPLTAVEIQQLLDENTLLLEYALGEERSWLWVVSRSSIKSFTLPKRAEIEATARRCYNLLTARNQAPPGETAAQRRKRVNEADAQFTQAAAELSRMILAPAAAEFAQKRLLLVAQGALQYVPFAALPAPQKGQPLIVRHELVSVPSASLLPLLRREGMNRRAAPKTIAVFADPVFTIGDERIRNSPVRNVSKAVVLDGAAPKQESIVAPFSDSLLRTLEALQPEQEGANTAVRISRLSGTRWEAEKIGALVPASQKLIALDFQASRDLATSGTLSQYRILHFASHALINTIHPDLSGIVLSLVDREGRAQDGFLRANEIYNLQLAADLVVLSACQTGLGKDVKGEGLTGLMQSFMYAGAPRVVVSLWSLQDKATAELMARFYQRLLSKKKLAPAAALRAAQVEMWQMRRWPSPYFWAGFVLQGEWK